MVICDLFSRTVPLITKERFKFPLWMTVWRLAFGFLQQIPVAFTPGLQFRIYMAVSFVEGPCIEIYTSIDVICKSVLDYSLDKWYHLRYVLCHSGEGVRFTNTEASHVLEKLGFPVRG
jgi:hypothetical protein